MKIRVGLALSLMTIWATVAGVTASENMIDYAYQVWKGLGSGEPQIVRTPIVATAMPESQFAAIFAPACPVQMTSARVDEINLAVACGFTPRSTYRPENVFQLTIDASQADCPGDPSSAYRDRVAGLIFESAIRVAVEQLTRYAPGQSPRFVLRLHWNANDPRNREQILPPPD